MQTFPKNKSLLTPQPVELKKRCLRSTYKYVFCVRGRICFLGRTYVSLTSLADVRISGCWLNTGLKNSSNGSTTYNTFYGLSFFIRTHQMALIDVTKSTIYLFFSIVGLDFDFCEKIHYEWRNTFDSDF